MLKNLTCCFISWRPFCASFFDPQRSNLLLHFSNAIQTQYSRPFSLFPLFIKKGKSVIITAQFSPVHNMTWSGVLIPSHRVPLWQLSLFLPVCQFTVSETAGQSHLEVFTTITSSINRRCLSFFSVFFNPCTYVTCTWPLKYFLRDKVERGWGEWI